jgi:hypothetical protein
VSDKKSPATGDKEETPSTVVSENNKDEHASLNPLQGGVEIHQPSQQLQKEIEVDENFRAPDELLKAQSLANLLDTAIKIPFIPIRLGLDFLIGLIPGIGDMLMLFASLRIIHLGRKIGVPKPLLKKMMINSVIDYCLGFFPIVGDLVDLFFKANQRNVRIMESWWVSENKEQIDALAKRQLDDWHAKQALHDSDNDSNNHNDVDG